MPTIPRTYDALIRALRWSSPLFGSGSSKLATGIRGREDAGKILGEWAEAHRDPDRPLIWSHAPSVGEGLQARAVLEALGEACPDLQAVYTHFSPSAESLASRMPVDVATYLPWDVRGEMDRLLDRLRPRLVAFTKTEVWPGVMAAAGERGIPVVLTAATLPAGARRLRAPSRHLLSGTFGALSAVLAISEEDGDRFRRLGVSEDRISVTGDPGIDSARERASGADPSAPHLAPFHPGSVPTLVAGSTWEPDEGVLLPALQGVRQDHRELRAIVAPHEPTEEHLERLASDFRARGWRTERLAEVEREGRVSADAVLVDRVGVLADLYTVGTMAYVGGGFGRAGLHSVLEPASAGIPVLFGPRHGNARAAAELERAGGGHAVAGADALGSRLSAWLRADDLRREAGTRASQYIDGHRGAARRTAAALLEHLSPSDGADL